MGVFQDKEYEKIIRLTIPYAKCVYTVDLPNKERTLSAQKLKEAVEAQSEYVPAYAVGEIKQAVKEALENARQRRRDPCVWLFVLFGKSKGSG